MDGGVTIRGPLLPTGHLRKLVRVQGETTERSVSRIYKKLDQLIELMQTHTSIKKKPPEVHDDIKEMLLEQIGLIEKLHNKIDSIAHLLGAFTTAKSSEDQDEDDARDEYEPGYENGAGCGEEAASDDSAKPSEDEDVGSCGGQGGQGGQGGSHDFAMSDEDEEGRNRGAHTILYTSAQYGGDGKFASHGRQLVQLEWINESFSESEAYDEPNGDEGYYGYDGQGALATAAERQASGHKGVDGRRGANIMKIEGISKDGEHMGAYGGGAGC